MISELDNDSSDRESSPEWHDIGDEIKKPPKPLNAHFHYGRPHEWTVEDECDQSEWTCLPDLIMEKIFSYLSISERYSASMVCKRWNSAFYLPHVWHMFEFGEQTLTRRRFNYYSGWQHTLDHLRAQLCLGTVGRHFRVLIFVPMTNFYNMYEFMNMISFYAEQQDSDRCPVRGISRNIRTLKYVFPCKHLSGEDEQESTRQQTLYGTGGKLLDAVKRLMGNLRNLRRLELIDLMLDNFEAMTLLDDVCCECCQTLRFLSLTNFTKRQCLLIHVGVFINLQVLVIGPQNLGEEIMELLSWTKLKHLHIAQTGLTPTSAQPLSPKCWRETCKRNPTMKVHLSLETKTEKSFLWQEGAPVYSILIDSPVCELSSDVIMRTCQFYSESLRFFGYKGLLNLCQLTSFNGRTDAFILMLANECSHLDTLVVRDQVAAATLLLVADQCKSLKRFYVRRKAVVHRFDWPRNPSWDDKYLDWLETSSKTIEIMETEISGKLATKWKTLADNEFVSLDIAMY